MIFAKISQGSAIEIKIDIPAGLEAAFTVLLEGADPQTVTDSSSVILRKSGDPLSLNNRKVVCTAVGSDFIGLGIEKTIIFQLLDNGNPVGGEGAFYLKAGTKVFLCDSTYHLKEV